MVNKSDVSKDTNRTRRIISLKDKLNQCVINLGKLNVPALFVYFEKKQVFHFGTLGAMTKFEATTDCKCKCDCGANNSLSWKDAFKEDRNNLANGEEKVFEYEKITKLGITNYLTTRQKPKKLSAPLSVARYHEITNYLNYLIRLEHAEMGFKGTNLIYGSETWRPRDCWIEQDFSWSQVYTSFNHLKSSDYPGPGKLIDFFRRCVKKGLDARGIDPETYYSESFSDKELDKRRRRRRMSNVEHNEQFNDGEGKKRMKDYDIGNKEMVTEDLENYYFNQDYSTYHNQAIQNEKDDYDFLNNSNDNHLNDQDLLIKDSIKDCHTMFNEKSNNTIDTENMDGFLKQNSVIVPNKHNPQVKMEPDTKRYDHLKYKSDDYSGELTKNKSRRKSSLNRTKPYEKINPEKKRRNDSEASILNKTKEYYYNNSHYKSVKFAENDDTFPEKRITFNENDEYFYSNSDFNSFELEENNDTSLNKYISSPARQTQDTMEDDQIKNNEKIKNQENDNSRSDEITNFFTSLSLPDLADLFNSEEVTIEILSEMTGDDLKDLGVSKYGQRFNILKHVKNFRLSKH